ncbi:cation-transporting P-type ATPase, partial [Klebsiella pneumoniae]|nr:cation-transporting P-type ATPase [Klebsiella pneumoniae]
VLGISALVEAAQRVSADRELKQLLATNQVLARRRRGRKTELVPAEDLLVGDVIELRAGDWVPADCRLLEVDGLETDESTLTGESLPVVKDTAATTAATTADRRCMLYQGTSVASGSGTAVVVATGEN